jgi:hypothetical protein
MFVTADQITRCNDLGNPEFIFMILFSHSRQATFFGDFIGPRPLLVKFFSVLIIIIITIIIFFFFFHWHYSPLWALPCRIISFIFSYLSPTLSNFSVLPLFDFRNSNFFTVWGC